MAIIDVVKFDSNDEEFVWKFPSENLRLGTQLVVKTSQTAIFVKGGKILDVFKEGTYTLKTGNIPLLHKVISIPFGGDSPFQAEVWYLNLISKLDNRWGTVAPIQLEDPRYGIIVPVRAFGQFGIRISEPKVFLERLIGTIKVYTADKIIEYFTGKILSSISTVIGKKIIRDKISILDISLLLEEISSYTQQKIQEEFNKYGIEVLNFYFISINIPQDDPSVIKLKEAKEKGMLINTVGKDVYSFDRSMDVLEKAAENEGEAGNMMGMGMGLGMGVGVGGAMGSQMGNIGNQMKTNLENNQQNPQNSPPPPPIMQYFVLINDEQKGPFNLEQIKQMIQNNTFTKDTYIWKQGMPEWVKSGEQQELNNLFNQMPPPPPVNK